MKTINYRLRRKFNEIYSLEPNNLVFRPLTFLYKKVTHYFKTTPFIIVIPLSFLIAFSLYFIFGYFLVYDLSIFISIGNHEWLSLRLINRIGILS